MCNAAPLIRPEYVETREHLYAREIHKRVNGISKHDESRVVVRSLHYFGFSKRNLLHQKLNYLVYFRFKQRKRGDMISQRNNVAFFIIQKAQLEAGFVIS